jgi:hypothetical protein
MKKIRSIDLFNAKNENDFVKLNLQVGNEVCFPPRSAKQQICFSDENEVCIDLIHYNREKAVQFPLREGKVINKKELIELGRNFSFNVIPYKLYKDIMSGTIPEIPKTFGLTCFGTIILFNTRYYFMIFAKRGITDFEDDIIFVHGIWEVGLSQEIVEKLFHSANTSI